MSNLTERWAGLRMLHETVMAEDAQKLLALNRDAVRAHNEQMIGKPSSTESDGMIHVGDTHIHQSSSPDAAPRSGLGTLGKLALGAALMASGAGVAAGLPMLIGAIRPESHPPPVLTPQSVPNSEIDLLRDYELRLGSPE